MIFYHGTSGENFNKIILEGILFGERKIKGYNPSRCTYLTSIKEEAEKYGEVVLEVNYNPFINKQHNNYCKGCWQFRVYEPIKINNIKKL